MMIAYISESMATWVAVAIPGLLALVSYTMMYVLWGPVMGSRKRERLTFGSAMLLALSVILTAAFMISANPERFDVEASMVAFGAAHIIATGLWIGGARRRI